MDRLQDYKRLINELSMIDGVEADYDHEHVCSIYHNKRLILKLMFGTFESQIEPSIVITFHMNLKHHEVVYWYVTVYKIEANLIIHDSFIEDDAGETYLGEDAEIIQDFKKAQDTLKDWLDTSDAQEVDIFTNSKIVGRERPANQTFDVQFELERAIIEFNTLRKPKDGEYYH